MPWKRGDKVLACSKGVFSTYSNEMYEARVLKVHKIGRRGFPRYLLDLRFSNDFTEELKTPVQRSGRILVIHDDDVARLDY